MSIVFQIIFYIHPPRQIQVSQRFIIVKCQMSKWGHLGYFHNFSKGLPVQPKKQWTNMK